MLSWTIWLALLLIKYTPGRGKTNKMFKPVKGWNPCFAVSFKIFVKVINFISAPQCITFIALGLDLFVIQSMLNFNKFWNFYVLYVPGFVLFICQLQCLYFFVCGFISWPIFTSFIFPCLLRILRSKLSFIAVALSKLFQICKFFFMIVLHHTFISFVCI